MALTLTQSESPTTRPRSAHADAVTRAVTTTSSASATRTLTREPATSTPATTPGRTERGEAWASGGVVAYGIVWHPVDPADARNETISRVGRRARSAARVRIEQIARTLAGAARGVAVDDDGFLVALE